MLVYAVCLCLIAAAHGRTTPPLPDNQPTTTTTTESPTTTTAATTLRPRGTTARLITECEAGRIRAHSDQSKFEVLTQDENGTDVWRLSDCQLPGLIFNESFCACVYPPQDPCPYNEVEGSSVEYQEALPPFTVHVCTPANTFWNQTGCRCDWNPDGPQAVPVPDVTPCETIFSADFDSSPVADIVVNGAPSPKAVGAPGANGNALAILPQRPTLVWKVSYTDFGPGFVLNFRFRSRNDIGTRESYVALITNGCWAEETIVVSYRAIDRSYQVSLGAVLLEERVDDRIEFTCQDTSAVSDGFQWNTVSLSFAQGVVSLTVNDVLCRTEERANAIPQKPKCPLVLGNDIQGENARPGLFGWFDEISLRRFCLN